MAKDLSIGKKFVIDNIIYEVRKSITCKDCACCIEGENECTNYNWRFGLCNGENRQDGQDVVFVQVGEETAER